ncbi:MAG: hypothetical protein KF855_08630 [Acidobacteria bacterium]|nr:hypothetical protein [Acidobacteriota bacterium]
MKIFLYLMGVVSFVFGMLCMGRSIEMYSETSFTSTKTVFILGLVGIFLGIFWIKKARALHAG